MILSTPTGDLSAAARPASPSYGWRSIASDTFAGRSVTPESSLGLAAVYGAVSLLANMLGSLPMEVIDERSAGREVVRRGWLPNMLRYRPNPDMTAQNLWTLVYGHLLLRGNAYLAKLPNTAGQIELWPLDPALTQPFRDENGRKLFRVTYGGTRSGYGVFTSEAVLHIMGPGYSDGLMGASPIELMRQSLGVQAAQNEYQARFYQQGAQLKGVLSAPGSLSPEAADRIKRQWREANSGLANAHDVAVVHSGVQFQNVSITPEDAQFVESKRWGHSEVATCYNIPASWLNGEAGSMQYSNVSMDAVHLQKVALQPRSTMVEQALNADTTLFGMMSAWVPRFNYTELLRADAETRYRTHEIAIRNRFKTPDEVRAEENLAALPVGAFPEPMPVQPVAQRSVEERAFHGRGSNRIESRRDSNK